LGVLPAKQHRLLHELRGGTGGRTWLKYLL
jgi:hypothetical protein